MNAAASAACRVLHDRRVPGSRANIDHIAVAPLGIHVIDAKRYKGRPQLKVEGGVLRPRVERLVVGTRGVQVLWPKRLLADLAARGVLDVGEVDVCIASGLTLASGLTIGRRRGHVTRS